MTRLPLFLLALLIGLAPVLLFGRDMAGAPIAAKRIVVPPGDAGRIASGRLAFTDGWVLRSRDRRFGGLSALVALGPGRLLAVSDTADPVLIEIGRSRPTARLLPRLETGAARWMGKAGFDVESLTRDPASGRLWAGLERYDSIVRYDEDLSHHRRVEPPAMASWPANGGAESLTRLPDGRFLVIAEKVTPHAGLRTALLFPRDPTTPETDPVTLAYRPPRGFDPSDAAALPDGRVLVLNRRLSFPHGFTATLTLVDPRGAGAGTVLEPETVATFAPPFPVDNMEGMAVSLEHGETIVYLVSDDNFMPFERTLLLRFRLLP